MGLKLKKGHLFIVLLLFSLCLTGAHADNKNNKKSEKGEEKETEKGTLSKGVTFDGTSLMINGKRELIISGSVHYPRSTPDMWPDIIEKAKRGGLNTIQTYVFWNVHEPEQGKFNFTGPNDLVGFIKLIQSKGMYVTLRLGPFIQAEWNHGGLPYWLREVKGIYFRTNNKPWKDLMEKFVRMIVEMIKKENLFASQGGPIILAQIENEYSQVQRAYKEEGQKYLKWAANLVNSMNLGIPWAMCKQNDAPDNMINACNGRQCGDTFPGPNNPSKPSIWTENWTTQFRVSGDPPTYRRCEDVAYSVARFFSKNGTHVNYYMFHGGTNFGRTSAQFVTTRYYDEAPLDEYGFKRGPKYGHLKHLHNAFNLCKKALLWGEHRIERFGQDAEARYYEQPGTKVCAAFLANNNTKEPITVKFKGQDYMLPSRSISILPDCKTVVYNTAQIVAQHSSRNIEKSEEASKGLKYEMFSENVPTDLPNKQSIPMELFFLTKDKTDYGWYTTSLKIDKKDLPDETLPVLRVASLGHALHAFVNGDYVGNAHGSHDEKSFVLLKPVKLKSGWNDIALMGVLTGLPDSGSYMEHRYAGPRGVSIMGLKSGLVDLTDNQKWGHLAGLEGEQKEVFTEEGSTKVKWQKANGKGPAFTWYKTYFDAPEGHSPVAVRMRGMGKGLIWVNGYGVGRYWMSFLSPLGQPTQSEYHIPRWFLKEKKNLLVILEEEPGVKPEAIDFVLVNRDTICTQIAENYPATVRLWKRQGDDVVAKTDDLRLKAILKCPPQKVIAAVEFASFGDPVGTCGNYTLGACNAPNSKEVVEKLCKGKRQCSIVVERKTFGEKKDECVKMAKTLAVQARCEEGMKVTNEEKDEDDSNEAQEGENEDDADDELGGEENEDEDKKNEKKKKKN